jgi:hypothetical protein
LAFGSPCEKKSFWRLGRHVKKKSFWRLGRHVKKKIFGVWVAIKKLKKSSLGVRVAM